MKHKRSGKKDYDSVVSPRNTPHLREKTIIIGMSFFFAGINFLFTGVRGAKVDGTLGRCFAIVGIVLILMSPISMVDPRRENRGTLAAFNACWIHLVITGAFAVLSSSLWWMAVYAGEVLIIAIAVYISFKHPKRHLPSGKKSK